MIDIDSNALCVAAFAVSSGAVGVAIVALRRKVSVATGLGDWRSHESDRQRIAQLEQMLAGERRENADLLAEHGRSMGRIAGLEDRVAEVQRQRDAARQATLPSGEVKGTNADLRLTITDLRNTIADLEKEGARNKSCILSMGQHERDAANLRQRVAAFEADLAECNTDNEAKRQRIRQLESLLQMEQARTGHGLNAVPLPVWAAQKIETLERQLRAPNAHQRNLCEGVALKYAREYRKRGDGDMNRAAADMADLIAREIRSLD
jgi:chromosome segregation ATPase